MFENDRFSKLQTFCEENGWEVEFNMDSQLFEVNLYPRKNTVDICTV